MFTAYTVSGLVTWPEPVASAGWSVYRMCVGFFHQGLIRCDAMDVAACVELKCAVLMQGMFNKITGDVGIRHNNQCKLSKRKSQVLWWRVAATWYERCVWKQRILRRPFFTHIDRWVVRHEVIIVIKGRSVFNNVQYSSQYNSFTSLKFQLAPNRNHGVAD